MVDPKNETTTAFERDLARHRQEDQVTMTNMKAVVVPEKSFAERCRERLRKLLGGS